MVHKIKNIWFLLAVILLLISVGMYAYATLYMDYKWEEIAKWPLFLAIPFALRALTK